MSKLRNLLTNRSWRALRALIHAHGQPFNSRLTKARAVERAAELLTDPTVVRRALHALPHDAREALETLAACGGSIQAHRFLASFGPIHPYRPWRAECPADAWRRPASPAERLWFLGFIFRYTTPEGETIVVPEELQGSITDRLSPIREGDAQRAVRSAPPPAPDTPDPILDVAHLLAYVQACDVRPLMGGRWLAPRHLKCLASGLASPDATAATARSELQTGYLRFLHYLAEAAGLVAVTGGLLKPTPAAWDWLDRPDADRWRALWEGWQTDLRRPSREGALWERFRLGGERPFMITALDVLSTFPPEEENARPGALIDPVRRRCIGAGSLPRAADVPESLERFLAGPLTWAGMVRLGGTGRVALTPLGRWLVGRAETPPTPPSMRPATLLPPGEDCLLIALPEPPARPPLRPLVELGLSVRERLVRCLEREHFVTLLSRGITRAHVVQGLRALMGGPLPPEALRRLTAWETGARALTLRRLVVLSAADPRTLTHLAAQRPVRPHLRETLSPHHVTVDPAGVEKLLRRLRRHGHVPLVEPGLDEPAGTKLDAQPDAGAAAHLWLALRLYLELGDLVRLPSVPPVALLDELARALDPDQLAALSDQAEEAGRCLRDALDGYTPYPAPIAGVDHARILATVEQAIVEDHPVEIVYHTAGRGERTTRVVEPLRLEERGGAAYLVAYCRLRRSERVFRLDRIEQARLQTMR